MRAACQIVLWHGSVEDQVCLTFSAAGFLFQLPHLLQLSWEDPTVFFAPGADGGIRDTLLEANIGTGLPGSSCFREKQSSLR